MSKVVTENRKCDVVYSSTSEYPFVYDGGWLAYRSSNQGIGGSTSEGVFKFVVPEGAYNVSLSFSFLVSSQETSDSFRYEIHHPDGMVEAEGLFGELSGNNTTYTNVEQDLGSENGEFSLTVRYKKNSTINEYNDTAYVKDVECSYQIDKKIDDKDDFPWNKGGRSDRFDVYLCERSASLGTIVELERIDDVTGSSITWNDNTTFKESGTISHIYDWDKYRDKLVRIYQTSRLENDSVTLCWGTYRIASDSAVYETTEAERTTNLTSVLWYLDAAKAEGIVQIPRGTNVLYYIRTICSKFNVPCMDAYDEIYLSKDITFPAGTSYLSIINELLDVANYFSAMCNEKGEVQLLKYTQPQSRPVKWTYEATGDTVLMDNQSNDKNLDDVPNVVIEIYEGENSTIVGVAKDKSSLSPTSTTSRGYEVTLVENVIDVATSEQTEIEIQNSLDVLAKQRLDSAKSNYETWEIESTYTPVSIRDTVKVTTKDGKKYDYTIKSMTRSMEPGVTQQMSIRRFDQ